MTDSEVDIIEVADFHTNSDSAICPLVVNRENGLHEGHKCSWYRLKKEVTVTD